jgi:hypothetical protein
LWSISNAILEKVITRNVLTAAFEIAVLSNTMPNVTFEMLDPAVGACTYDERSNDNLHMRSNLTIRIQFSWEWVGGVRDLGLFEIASLG